MAFLKSLAFPIILFAVSALIAWATWAYGDSDKISPVAVFAAVVGVGNILYGIVEKERERKKKDDDKKESIIPKLRVQNFTATGIPYKLFLDIYNSSKVAIHIEKVSLEFFNEGKTIYRDMGTFDKDDLRVKIEPTDVAYFKLELWFGELGDGQPFYQLNDGSGGVHTVSTEWLLKLKDDEFRIIIETYGSGRIATVPGSELRKYLEIKPMQS